MTTLTLDVPVSQKTEYKQVFTQFIRDYSIVELKEMQDRNNLYKKLSIIEKDEESQKMDLEGSKKYLDNLF